MTETPQVEKLLHRSPGCCSGVLELSRVGPAELGASGCFGAAHPLSKRRRRTNTWIFVA